MQKSKKCDKHSEAIELIESSGNVFEDLGFGEDSASLLLKADLVIAIIDTLEQNGWSNAASAKALGVKEPRISELRQGHVGKFSVDLLVTYLARLGKHVDISIRDHVG